MKQNNKELVLEQVTAMPLSSSAQLHIGLESIFSYATHKRLLTALINEQFIITQGQGRGTKYLINPHYQLFANIDIDTYFEQEIDDRQIIDTYNPQLLLETLHQVELFTQKELQELQELQKLHQANKSRYTSKQYTQALERLGVDLCWKSSQIEGNTYSLLETELLLKEQQLAKGKTRDEATMLLNHKHAWDFILNNPKNSSSLNIESIQNLHLKLISNLGVEPYIRTVKVGITGTNYRPLESESRIKQALNDMCQLIASKSCIYEKALLLLILISYIQPFEDGNKRTARLLSNAILIQHNYCPLSFRTVDALDYKKAMLLFYEQNNISHFKQLFIEQCRFAVQTYF